MTCFINLDYKYVHISFIASIHGFGPCMSFGQEESFPKLLKNLKVPGEVSRRTRVPRAHTSIAPCCHKVSLLTLALTHHLLPQRVAALHGVGAILHLFLVCFPTLSHHFPNHGL